MHQEFERKILGAPELMRNMALRALTPNFDREEKGRLERPERKLEMREDTAHGEARLCLAPTRAIVTFSLGGAVMYDSFS